MKLSAPNIPTDMRTRIETIADVADIPLPFVGMLFYVLDEGKYYIVKTLKSKNIKKVKDVLIFMIDENDDIFIQRKKE